ncbi:hypothetical protein ACFSJU_18985 [Paradesertivirga mongoliensis]|uniref:Uncharacterized protein n=2 Tax=Paradesertivirga mongoliensis TaxID=2100740 RepID=A0ABW4ZQT9_9SPHI
MGISLPTPSSKATNKGVLKCCFALAFSLTVSLTALAQAPSGSVGIGTLDPNDKAILDITATNKGLLIPRLTVANRDALLQPGQLAPKYNGMLVYVLDDSVTPNVSTLFVWKNDNWVEVGSGAAGLSAYEVWKSQQGNANKSLTDFFNELKGDTGDKGAAGATWYTEKVDPTSATPAAAVDGDYYLNTVSGDIFKKTAGAWGTRIGNLIVGKPGADGKSVTGVSINGAGQLVVTVSDGITTNVFTTSTPVKGADGQSALDLWRTIPGNELKDGTTFLSELKGANGLSINTAAVDAVTGNLALTMSDGTVKNVGVVKGTDGLGVQSAAIDAVTGNLALTMTDGTVKNAGVVKGTDGLGVQSAAVDAVTGNLALTMTDGTVKNAGVVKGTDGLGVQSAAVDAVTGNLALTMTDGTVKNAGVVKGTDGLGVQSAAVDAVTGNLALTMTDGTVKNAGVVKGTDGLGVQSAAVDAVTGNLALTMTDGTVKNAGVVKGTDGLGVQSAAVDAVTGNLALTMTDGTVKNAGVVKGSDAKGVTAISVLNNDLISTEFGQLELTFNDGSKVASTAGFWTLGGNPNTAGNISQYLGTSDSKPLLLATENTEKMRILPNGRVGIGTPTPEALLHVKGDFKLGNNGTVLQSIIHETVSADVPQIDPSKAVTQTFLVSNARLNAAVIVSPESPLPTGVMISYARVSVDGTVEVKFYNATAAALNPVSMNYSIGVINK